MTIPSLPLSSVDNLSSFLEQSGAWIQQEMLQHIPSQEPRVFLYDLMQDYPQRGGKKFRSSLVLLSCELFGGKASDALLSAVALELFQNFVLIHDDIEDESLIRRGKPTLHRIHGIPLAMNAGDSLMGLVYEVLTENQSVLGAEKSLEIIKYLALVFRHTFEGQALDIGWIAHQHFPNAEEYQQMIVRKTGWYSGKGPCQCGAMIAGASDEDLETIGSFGEAIGIGFQARDDLLNLLNTGDTTAYGKERGGDIAEGKRTLITIALSERLPAADRQKLNQILLKPREEVQDEEIEWAIQQAHQTGAIDTVIDYCKAKAQEAEKYLHKLPDTSAKSLMEELVAYLTIQRES